MSICHYCGKHFDHRGIRVKGEGNFLSYPVYCSEKCRREAEGVTAEEAKEEAKREKTKTKVFGSFLFKFFRLLIITGLIISVVVYIVENLN